MGEDEPRTYKVHRGRLLLPAETLLSRWPSGNRPSMRQGGGEIGSMTGTTHWDHQPKMRLDPGGDGPARKTGTPRIYSIGGT